MGDCFEQAFKGIELGVSISLSSEGGGEPQGIVDGQDAEVNNPHEDSEEEFDVYEDENGREFVIIDGQQIYIEGGDFIFVESDD